MRVQSQFIEMFGNSIHTKKLIEVCNIEKGSTITKEQTSNGDIPVVAGGLEPSCYHNVANRPAGMITVSASGANAGYVNYWEVPIFASDCNTIYPIELEKVSPIFMYWQLKVIQKQIYKLQKGGAQPHVYGKDLADMQIVQPPMEFQLRYIKIAEQADKSKFVGFKSQFIEMFGNTSKEKLGKFIQVIRGVSYKPSDVKTAEDPDTAVILRSNNINDANLNTDEVVYIDKNKVSGDQYLKINDIVVCASNGSKALVGKAAINKTLTNLYAHGSFCLLVRPKANINPVYLNTFFQTSLYKKQIDELAAGSNIFNIKQEHLINMILPLPRIEEQNKFAIIAEQADKSKYYN